MIMEKTNNEANSINQASCTLVESLGSLLKQDVLVRSSEVVKVLGKQSHTLLSSN